MSEAERPFPMLRQFARQAAKTEEETCDMCAEPIPPDHRHLLSLSDRQLLCACRACAILFDSSAAAGGERRLVPTRYRYLTDFSMSDMQWESLRLPVHMVFFAHNTPAERVVAIYPSPAGPTESLLTLEAWQDLERDNPVLKEMEPDVEAILINRVRENREYFLVPIDECYKLVGLIRASWKGLGGGPDVQQQIDHFFASLKVRAGVRGGLHA